MSISIPTKNKKESRYCKIYGFENKEIDDYGNLIKGGYIATTHLDSGFPDTERGVWIRDKIAKDTLDLWAEEINSGNPRANKISINHNREPHVAGVGVRGSARVDQLPKGEFGLYVDELIDQTKDNFDNTKYRLDNGLLDSHSIEFTTKNPITGQYLEDAVIEVEQDAGIIRTLLPGTILEGWTLASQPMNEHAVMIKELRKSEKKESKIIKNNEVKTNMADGEEVTEPIAPVDEPKADPPKEEPTEEAKGVSKEEYAEFKAYKDKMESENKAVMISKLVDEKVKEIKESLKNTQVEDKISVNPAVTECKELKEFKKMLSEKVDIGSMKKMAIKMAAFAGIGIAKDVKTVFDRHLDAERYSIKDLSTKESRIIGMECKGLSITTNQNTDTDYLLSAAELADVFDPVIYNILNQKTTSWNLLMKEDFSNKGNNQVQFALKIAANSTAVAYTGNAVSLGETTRLKYQTKFKKYQVGIEVDGDMLAAARGGPVGDVFAQEVQDSTDDLMAVLNLALFAEVGSETAAGVIGFEYITDQAGNTTLYSLSRTQANGLASTTTADNYINGAGADISLTNLRAAKRKAVGTEGADLTNCVFITSFVQGDKFRGIYDAAQRLVPTSSRFGFEGRPEFDGIPIFEDKDCNSDDWFLVDLETHKVAIWVPPTLELLGKDGDSVKGFIKTYFATYNRAPRRMVQIYSNKTT